MDDVSVCPDDLHVTRMVSALLSLLLLSIIVIMPNLFEARTTLARNSHETLSCRRRNPRTREGETVNQPKDPQEESTRNSPSSSTTYQIARDCLYIPATRSIADFSSPLSNRVGSLGEFPYYDIGRKTYNLKGRQPGPSFLFPSKESCRQTHPLEFRKNPRQDNHTQPLLRKLGLRSRIGLELERRHRHPVELDQWTIRKQKIVDCGRVPIGRRRHSRPGFQNGLRAPARGDIKHAYHAGSYHELGSEGDRGCPGTYGRECFYVERYQYAASFTSSLRTIRDPRLP